MKDLMRTLLIDYPTLLSDSEQRELMNKEKCKKVLGLQLGNFPLIRKLKTGRKGKDRRDRYYAKPYGDFYLCSQWWKDHHRTNAESLLSFVKRLARDKNGKPGAHLLKKHAQVFRDYLACL